MAEEIKNENGEEMVETEIFTLTDENGVESEFELLLSLEIEGSTYYALIPVQEDEDEAGEYIILRLTEENGEELLTTIDDDDEFDRISSVFDDALFGETDHDA